MMMMFGRYFAVCGLFCWCGMERDIRTVRERRKEQKRKHAKSGTTNKKRGKAFPDFVPLSFFAFQISGRSIPDLFRCEITLKYLSNMLSQGISVPALLDFVDEWCEGREAIQHKTTRDICQDYLRVCTSNAKSSYCDLLQSQGRPGVGPATVFVSHAWQCNFIDVLDALTEHFIFEREVFVWLDVFCFNQHETGELSSAWFSDSLKQLIKDIGRVVLVLSPCSDPMPLTRTWCLYEAYCALESGMTFEVALGSNERTQFISSIGSDCCRVAELIGLVNSRVSVCSKVMDKEQLIDAILEFKGGFDGLDRVVSAALRNWLIRFTQSALKDSDLSKKEIELKLVLASLYQQNGNFLDAEPLYQECLRRDAAMLGDSHPGTLAVMNNLAGMYFHQGKHRKSEALYLSCLTQCKLSLGKNHAFTNQVANNLAIVYKTKGNYSEALPRLVECVRKSKIVFGESHPQTLTAIHALAGLYRKLHKDKDAEALYLQCLTRRRSALGDDHPDTLHSIFKLATLYSDTLYSDTDTGITDGDRVAAEEARFSTSERLFRTCRDRREALLGNEHPDTILSIYGLAKLYDKQGRYTEAEELLVQCLKLRKKILCADHQDIQEAMNALAACYVNQDRLKDAEPLYRECLARSKSVLGEIHEDTLAAMRKLASVYEKMHRLKDAEPMYEECLYRLKSTIGERHIDTLTTKLHLGDVCYLRGKYSRAEAIYLETLEQCRSVLGEGYSLTCSCLSSLATLYERLQRYDEARLLHGQCLALGDFSIARKHSKEFAVVNNSKIWKCVLQSGTGASASAATSYLSFENLF